MAENKFTKRSRSIIWYALLLAGLTYYLGSRYHYAPDASIATLRFIDEKGNQMGVEAFREKPLFINFYASWCGPCRAEIPSLKAAADSLKNEIRFIALTDDPFTEIHRFTASFGPDIKVYQLIGDLRGNGVPSIPTSFLIDKQGRVVYSKSGGLKWDSDIVLNELRNALKTEH